MKVAKLSSMVFVFSLMASMALAQPPGGQGGGRGGRGGQGGGVMALFTSDSPIKRLTDAIDKLDLTDEQKTKIADIKKEYEPKFKDIKDKMTAVLTDDQKKAVEDGKKKISEATGQEAQDRDAGCCCRGETDQRSADQVPRNRPGDAAPGNGSQYQASRCPDRRAESQVAGEGRGRGGAGGGRGGRGGGGNGGGATREST